MIKILRSVKQGDALSCALFILCIDPLIRKIESNPSIISVQIPRSNLTGINITSKIAGFADDIGAAINNDRNSINNVFTDYALFSSLSGIELNLDKTEILKMNVNSLHRDFEPFHIDINNSVRLETVESLSICGICFSNNDNVSYGKNILDKIVKMERQLIIWLQRPLSMEGKILIVKTFGLSQLIYALQMCHINEPELIDIERMIFKFLWNKKWVGSTAPDRIKRATLKLPFDKGGLQAPDIVHINRALKVKQFLRSMKTIHPINLIQRFQLERIGYDDYYKCEYAKMCHYDNVIKMYQVSCNLLTDQFRAHCSALPLPDPDKIGDVVSVVASTDILEFLMRKKQLMLINRFGALANEGIINYRQLYNEAIYPRYDWSRDLARYLLKFFPPAWTAAMELTLDFNSDLTYEFDYPTQNLQLCKHEQITVKSIRNTFLENQMVPPYPYTEYQKFQLTNVNNLNPFTNIRKFIHRPRDKFFKYRILQGDIFCNERMFRFKMVNSKFCSYCGISQTVENIKHMIWDCPRSQEAWLYLKNVVLQSYSIDYISYETVILGAAKPIPLVESIIVLVLKLIMTKERSTQIQIEQIKNQIKAQYIIEKHAMKNNLDKFNSRWSNIQTILFHDFID